MTTASLNFDEGDLSAATATVASVVVIPHRLNGCICRNKQKQPTYPSKTKGRNSVLPHATAQHAVSAVFANSVVTPVLGGVSAQLPVPTPERPRHYQPILF